MTFATSEYVLWASGTLLYGSLAWMMIGRRLYMRAPVFTCWIAQMFLAAVVLFGLSRFRSFKVYNLAFWFFAFVEFGLQLGVIFEFANLSMRHEGLWLAGSKKLGIVGSVSSIAVSILLVANVQPAVADLYDAFFVRVELFVSLLTLLLTFLVFALSERLGSCWSSSDLYRFMGYLVLVVISALTDSLHTYWRTATAFLQLEIVRMVVSQATLIYWIATLRSAPVLSLRKTLLISRLKLLKSLGVEETL